MTSASDSAEDRELDCCGCGPGSFDSPAEVDFGDHRLDPVQLTVRAAGFRLLLETGRPTSLTAIVAEAGVDLATARKVLDGFAARGNCRLRGDELVGIAGLSVEPTPHRIDLAIGRRWAWCAIDAVGIVGAAGDGSIRSETINGAVELRVRNGVLESIDLAVFVADGYGMTSSVDQWCTQVNFFATSEAAAIWAEKAGVAGRPVMVSGIATRVIERWRAILDHRESTSGTCRDTPAGSWRPPSWSVSTS